MDKNFFSHGTNRESWAGTISPSCLLSYNQSEHRICSTLPASWACSLKRNYTVRPVVLYTKFTVSMVMKLHSVTTINWDGRKCVTWSCAKVITWWCGLQAIATHAQQKSVSTHGSVAHSRHQSQVIDLFGSGDDSAHGEVSFPLARRIPCKKGHCWHGGNNVYKYIDDFYQFTGPF